MQADTLATHPEHQTDLADHFELRGPAVPDASVLDALAQLLIGLHRHRQGGEVPKRGEADTAA
jgi:hypothetical protein